MEETILKDLERIEKTLYCSDWETEGLQRELVAKYRSKIDHIASDLDQGFCDFSHSGNDRLPDYTSNLIGIKGKLEVLLAQIKDEKNRPKEQPFPQISLVNTNSSDNHASNTLSNTNTIHVELLFKNAKDTIENDTSLGDAEIDEIMQKINELEALHSSNENKRSKWSKSKETLKWVIDKGAKVAEVVLPLITAIIG